MKKIISIVLSTLFISFALTGCNNKTENNPTDNAMQELYNRSTVAKEYADKAFNNLIQSVKFWKRLMDFVHPKYLFT